MQDSGKGQSSTYTGLSTARVTQRDDFGDIVPALRHTCRVVCCKKSDLIEGQQQSNTGQIKRQRQTSGSFLRPPAPQIWRSRLPCASAPRHHHHPRTICSFDSFKHCTPCLSDCICLTDMVYHVISVDPHACYQAVTLCRA